MHIAFVDIAASYHAGSPFEGPLGGTQSAVCYLAAELAKKGLQVTLVNQLRETGVHLSVHNEAPERLNEPGFLKSFDAVILNGRWTEKLAKGFRRDMKESAPLIAWMHEAAFQIPYAPPVPEFSAYVFVSKWHVSLNAELVSGPARAIVLGNGISPGFEGLFAKDAAILAAKSPAPIAVYCGSSKRGLLDLPEMIPALCRGIPGLTFEIYSDCAVSTDAAENAASLEKFRNIPFVTHAGTVPQNILAQKLKRAHFFVAPNDYPESFCIALAEAMAAGLSCITTTRAALPETAAGFAALLPVKNPDTPEYAKGTLDVPAFTAHALKHMKTGLNEENLQRQVAYANAHFRWERRAAAWIGLLKS